MVWQERAIKVTPLAGVWIEILPDVNEVKMDAVTPLAGVWIEMFELRFASGELLVTPLAGVWIEIWVKTWRQSKRNWSLPLRKCELVLSQYSGHRKCDFYAAPSA